MTGYTNTIRQWATDTRRTGTLPEADGTDVDHGHDRIDGRSAAARSAGRGQPGAVSFVEIAALCAGCPIEDIVAQIQTNLPKTSVIALQNIVNQTKNGYNLGVHEFSSFADRFGRPSTLPGYSWISFLW